MAKFVDISGIRYGSLVVASIAARADTDRIKWVCICDCGETTIVSTSHIKSGHTVSCGCARTLDYCSIDLTEKRFGRLIAKKQIRGGGDKKPTKWECLCDCGNIHITATGMLTCGHTKSCGCLQREARKTTNRTHGMCKTATYYSWGSMIQRCTNPAKVKYPMYGGRGIKVCDRWLKFDAFFCDMGKKPDGMTLDRIDTNGHYSPENCRWATPKQQANNTRRNRYITCNGITKTLSQWSIECGISHTTISDRIKSGKSIEESLGFFNDANSRCKCL